jgi:hypothetical protein
LVPIYAHVPGDTIGISVKFKYLIDPSSVGIIGSFFLIRLHDCLPCTNSDDGIIGKLPCIAISKQTSDKLNRSAKRRELLTIDAVPNIFVINLNGLDNLDSDDVDI